MHSADAPRLDALRESGLLHGSDHELDRLARLAATALRAPVALVSLAAADRHVYPGCAGLPAPWCDIRESPLDPHERVEDAPLLVSDAHLQGGFTGSAVVKMLDMVAYAAVPVHAAEGIPLGCLCVMDRAPRAWAPEEVSLLSDLAALAEQRIARRRAGARELRWKEAVFDGLVEGAPVGILLVRPDGVIEMANLAFAELIGAPVAASLQGARIGSLVVSDGEAAFRAWLARVAAGEGTNRLETALQHPDGERIEVEVLAGPLPGAGGRLQIFVRDARERLLATRALDRSVALLQATLEASHDGVLAMDHAGRVLAANRRFSAIWGVPDPRLLQDDRAGLREVWSAVTDPQGFEAMVDELVGSHEAERREIVPFRDGRILELHSVPFRLGGESQGRVWTFSDITEARREEEVREELERKIRVAATQWTRTFDTLGVPFLLLDEHGLIARLNAAALAMLGAADYPAVLGRPLTEVAPGEPWATAARAMAETSRTGEHASTRLRDPSGRSWDIVTSYFEGGDPPTRMGVLLMRDVTEPARSDQMLALGSLLAGVAHEVRNPLFGISSTLDAMEACLDDDTVRRFSTVLRTQVVRLGALMQDLLDYGRPVEYTLRPGAVASVAKTAVALCTPLAEASEVSVVAEVGARLPEVAFDRTRLEQALENVVDNAVRHSPRGGTVRVRVLRHEAGVRCDVVDDGPGFGGADLAHVFDPFFTKRRGGTGLGLSLVQRIVHEHGGTVSAFNRPEGGACIRIFLPEVAQ